jgi:hypothetical protein
MIAELFQPACDVLVGLVLGDVVDEEGADCATVVSTGDGAVALLASGIPDLSLDGLVVDLNAASGELDADSGLAVQVEFIASETREKVGFTDAGVSNKHHLEEELWMSVSTFLGGVEGTAVCFDSSGRTCVHRTRRWPWSRWVVCGCWWWSGGGVRRNCGLVVLLYVRRSFLSARMELVEGRTMRGCFRQEECLRSVGLGSRRDRDSGLFVCCLATLAALPCCSLTVTSPDLRP